MTTSVQHGAYSEGYKQGQDDLLNEMHRIVVASMNRNECCFDHDELVWLESIAKVKGITIK